MLSRKKVSKILHRVRVLGTGPVWFVRDYVAYRRLAARAKTRSRIALFPKVLDRDPASHTFDKHYVYMDRWAFKRVLEKKPPVHVDVGSSIRFLSMVSAVSKLTFVDIRPVRLDFDNYTCVEGSILRMPFTDNSVESLSCLHVAEHIGLGRYGDPLDPDGSRKACRELARVLKPGGSLYFALPIGHETVYFNAHRVHNPETILRYFDGLDLVSFSAVDDSGHFHESAKPEDYRSAAYACGMYEFTKK